MNACPTKLLLALAVCICQTYPAKAYLQDEVEEERLSSCNDWVINVSISKLRDYFKYQGSNLYPVIKIHVTCGQFPGAKRPVEHVYEDLWYHNGRIIGSHRASKLPFGNYKLGSVVVKRSEFDAVESAAIANTIARLTVDLKLKQSTIAAVIIPVECFHQVCTDLGAYGFYKHDSSSYFPLSLHLTSSPRSPSDDVYLFHIE